MPEHPAHNPDRDDGDCGLHAFGFETAAETWMDHLRGAEASLPCGCIGEYELLEEIGRGGQGIVYRAVQRGTDRPIAIKRLLAGSFATASMRRRFERELEVLAGLTHPNIVAVFGMKLVDGVPLLAMEWIDGIPITRWAAQQKRQSGQWGPIVRVFLEVCAAVSHAHQRGVIHRDLKPSNILIDAANCPHVLDFGLAKLIAPQGSSPRSASLTDQFVGTLRYASPEQFSGRPNDVDVRSDVYSLGVLLYEALVDRVPCEGGDSLAATAQAIVQCEPLRPSKIIPRLSRDLEAITLKALAKDKGARYQSADAMTADLRSYLTGEPVSARLEGGMARLLKRLRRYRLAVAFGATVLVLVTAFAVAAARLAGQLAEQYERASTAQQREAQAREQAEHEAAKRRAINSFLQQMLASADPQRAKNPGLAVRDILDAAAGRIETDLTWPIDIQADIRRVLARSYESLGLYDEAGAQLRRALELHRSLHGDDHPEVLVTLSHLATLLHVQGDYAAAAPVAEEAVRLARSVLERGHGIADADLNGLVAYLFMNGDHEGAEALYRDTLAAHRRLFGNESEVVAGDLGRLSSLLVAKGEYEAALALAREGVAIRRRLMGDDHEDVREDLLNLATILHAKGDDAEAEEIYRELVDGHRGDGNENAMLADALYHYGRLQEKLGKLVEAESALRETLALHQKLFGPDYPGLAICRRRLGLVLVKQGAYAEAEGLLRTALEEFRQTLPAGHWRAAYAQNDLGGCLTALSRYVEAEPMLLNSHPVIRDKHGDVHVRTLRSVRRIIELYEAWGRPAQAEPWRAVIPTSAP